MVHTPDAACPAVVKSDSMAASAWPPSAHLHEAIGDQLTCILVDHGLMRKNEAPRSCRCSASTTTFRWCWWMHPTRSSALEGEADPETKRKTIGKLFIDVFEEEARKVGGADFLAQGTLYPDVIESVSFSGGPSVTIKSHHNVGGLPERMNMQLVEPLARTVQGRGEGAGPRAWPARKLHRTPPVPRSRPRHPLPRRHHPREARILQPADAIYLDEIRKAGLYDTIWQAFAVLLPVQTVGVMGDGRTYEFVCALRAVTSVDGMTADFYPYDMDFLGKCRHPHHQRGQAASTASSMT
jgi:GMP synthase (glutamine-hydrolysing)